MAIRSAGAAFALGVGARRLLAQSVRQAQSPLLLLVLSGLPVLAAAWAVLSPPVMLSKAMTQDLLFNLSGAWHVYSGHIAHVDFHGSVTQRLKSASRVGRDIAGEAAANPTIRSSLFHASTTRPSGRGIVWRSTATFRI